MRGLSASRLRWMRRVPGVDGAARWVSGLRATRVIARSGLFDREWYEVQTGSRFSTDLRAVRHYVRAGRSRGFGPHPLFEPSSWNPRGWSSARRDPFQDYLEAPQRAGKRLHPLWHHHSYVEEHPQAQGHPLGVLGHLASAAPEVVLSVGVGRIAWSDLRQVLGEGAQVLLGADARKPVGPWPSCETATRTATEAVHGVVRVSSGIRGTTATVDSLLRDGACQSVDLVLATEDRVSFVCAYVLPHLDQRIRVHTESVADWGEAISLVRGRLTGRYAVLCAGGLEPEGDCVPALVAELDAGADVVQPLVLAASGAVVGAGGERDAAGSPISWFYGHPPEDLVGLGRLDAPVALGGMVGVRLEVLSQVESSTIPQGDDLTWLSSGTSGVGAVSVLTDAVARWVRGEGPVLPSGGWIETPWSAGASAPMWERSGFEVEGLSTSTAGTTTLLIPRLARPSGEVLTGPGAGLPRLRWALNIAAPAGAEGESWGDRHFAHALARSLRTWGQEVVVNGQGASDLPTAHLDDVNLVIRGLEPVPPKRDTVNLLWVISHPDAVPLAEMAAYDRCFAASRTWAGNVTETQGVEVRPLLQCTDPSLFHPDLAEPADDPAVVFVGNSRGLFRPVVRHVVEAGIPLHVIGGSWERFLPASMIMRTYVPNHEVGVVYRRAGVVLNDHWDDMRERGFSSNRLFDATAAGARVLTDHVDGDADLFGDSVRSWTSPEELVALLRVDVTTLFGDDASRRETAARVARDHSFDRRAEELLRAALEVLESR